MPSIEDDELDEAAEFLREQTKGMAESISRDFDPQEDWAPALFAVIPAPPEENEKWGVALAMFEPAFLDNKDEMAKAIASAGRQLEAEVVALLTTAWTVRAEEETNPELMDAERLQSLEHHPMRVEALTLITVARDGSYVMEMAEITRHEDGPPTLDNGWDLSMRAELGGEASVSGRFPEALAKAVGAPVQG